MVYCIAMSTKQARDAQEPTHTSQDVARLTGKSLQAVQRLALNYGLGIKREGRRLFSDAEVEIIRSRSQPGWPPRKPRKRRAKPAPAAQEAA